MVHFIGLAERGLDTMSNLIPAAFLPNVEYKANVYYVAFPDIWKEALYEIENLKRGKPFDHNLPTISLEKILVSWLPGMVALNPISKNGDTSKWLISCDPVDVVLLAELIKVWLISEYIENSYINPAVRDAVHNKAKDLYKLIDRRHLICNEPVELKMFDNAGKAACGETFRVLGLEIVNRLVGKELLLGDRKVRLLYSGKNELTTDPVELYTGKNRQYFSIVIKFSIQTTPPERKAFIVYNLSVRRWVSVPSKAWNYKKSNTKAYIRINDDTLQVMEFGFNRKDQLLFWDEIDKKCYELYKVENQLANINDVIKSPADYISNKQGSMVLTYRYALDMEKHKARPGLPMIDRINIHQWLLEQLPEIALATEATTRASKSLGGLDDTVIQKQLKAKFRERIAQAIDSNILALEIYCNEDSKMGQAVCDRLREDFGLSSDKEAFAELTASVCIKPLGKIGDPLDSNLSKLERFQRRVAEIEEMYGKTDSSPTACIIVLPGKDAFGDDERDPKKAIRAGLAATGRLTQFIVPFSEEEEDEDTPDGDSKHRVESAVYDLYRQLGYLYPLKEKRKEKEADFTVPAMGIWIVDKKDTVYGGIERFPIFVTTDYVSGQVRVDCGLFSRPNILYWEACLEFQKMPGVKEIKEIVKKNSFLTVKAKMVELFNTQKKPLLVLVKSDRNSQRFWKQISDTELSKEEKMDKYTLKRLWFDNSDVKSGIDLETKDTGVRIMRYRGNGEVPDYISIIKENGKTTGISGLYRYGDVYWSIASQPNDKLFRGSHRGISKVVKPEMEYKKPDMMEYYPIHLKKGDNPAAWAYLAHVLRKAAHQYKETLRMPLPLHFAEKLEEYLE